MSYLKCINCGKLVCFDQKDIDEAEENDPLALDQILCDECLTSS